MYIRLIKMSRGKLAVMERRERVFFVPRGFLAAGSLRVRQRYRAGGEEA
jgi:hypothetical protein